MFLPALKSKKLPPAPPLLSLLGPSFILLGLGLGSGELILWPYLTSIHGLGIIWGAVLGITLQFFINMEIARYTLATGESVFVGLTRKIGVLTPIWFLLSTLVPWMWPGIIASSSVLLSHLLGIPYKPVIPILMLVGIGIIYTLGPVIYKTQENLQKAVIFIGVPFIFALVLYLTESQDFAELGKGVLGLGTDYFLLPKGVAFATFLAAFAYSGAGGNLNLGQSLYVKEKGYGMGLYSGKLTSFLTGKKEEVRLTGSTYENTPKNAQIFKSWWNKINIEHGVVFWATGVATMLFLALLSFKTVYGKNGATGVQFIVEESEYIKNQVSALLGILFLAITALMLFFTQFSLMGTVGRICSENLLILFPKNTDKSGVVFYFFLWLQIILGIIVFSLGFKEPLTLVIIGAVLNAFSMFIYTGLILWLNKTSLYASIRPNKFRTIAVSLAFLFYGGFSLFTIFDKLF